MTVESDHVFRPPAARCTEKTVHSPSGVLYVPPKPVTASSLLSIAILSLLSYRYGTEYCLVATFTVYEHIDIQYILCKYRSHAPILIPVSPIHVLSTEHRYVPFTFHPITIYRVYPGSLLSMYSTYQPNSPASQRPESISVQVD